MSLIRVILLFAVWLMPDGTAACICWIGSGEPYFLARFKMRCELFRLFHKPRPVRTTPLELGGWRFRSCRASHLVLTEFGAVDPHTMQ